MAENNQRSFRPEVDDEVIALQGINRLSDEAPDANAVDGADFLAWQRNVMEDQPEGAETSAVVDAADYTVWRDAVRISPTDVNADGSPDAATAGQEGGGLWNGALGVAGGDTNNDGVADIAPSAQSGGGAFNTGGTQVTGDYNGDGVVDAADYLTADSEKPGLGWSTSGDADDRPTEEVAFAKDDDGLDA